MLDERVENQESQEERVEHQEVSQENQEEPRQDEIIKNQEAPQKKLP